MDLLSELYLEFYSGSNDGNPDLARRALEAGVSVNEKYHDCTLLYMIVAQRDALPVVRHLLERGADVSICNNFVQETVLHRAAKKCADNYDLHKLLLESGADCNARDRFKITPFLLAFASVNMKIVQLYLNNGADITAIDNCGLTALHYAAGNPCAEDVIPFLLKQGFDIDCRTNSGDTPLNYAAAYGTPEGCELLLRRGAMANVKSGPAGRSLLLFLLLKMPFATPKVAKSAAQVIRMLLEYGAQMTDKVGGKTILQMTAREGFKQCIRDVLMQHMAKMRYLNLEIDECDRQTIENEDCYKNYYQRCLQELEDMQATKFYGNLTIFNIFVGRRQVISGYARNQDLVQAFLDNDYEHKFPIYFASSKKRFCAEVERQKLRNIAAKILSNILKVNSPGHPVNQEVLNFLCDEDLKHLEM